MSGWRVETGPGWELRCGNCLDPATGLASLGDRSVDHVITDPPYKAEAHTLQRRTKATGADFAEVLSAPLDFAAISEVDRSRFATEAARASARWALAFCQAEAVAAWRDAFLAAGSTYRRACVWIKPDAMPQLTGDRPGMGYESIVACHRRGRSSWNGGGKPGVYVYNKNRSDLERTGHQTQKPLALMEALVSDFTDLGELVCDPFSGSGTTGVACIRLGRRFIGWEREPKYFDVAVKRLRAAREQLRIPLAVDPVGKQVAMFDAAPLRREEG